MLVWKATKSYTKLSYTVLSYTKKKHKKVKAYTKCV